MSQRKESWYENSREVASGRGCLGRLGPEPERSQGAEHFGDWREIHLFVPEVTWNGTFSLPPGVTVYDIDTYIRPSTSGSWTAGMATWGMNGQWTGWWSTNPSAAGSYVFGRLRYMSGSQWYSVDSNTRYIDSPYN